MDLDIFNELILDESNPRFGNISSQPAVLKHFSLDPKTKLLAKDIAENGLSPIERFIALNNKDGSYTILEGNRRIASIKLMDAPELADGDIQQKYFKKLAEKANLPDKVDCYVVDDRDAAFDWIDRRHSGPLGGAGTVPWSPVQKERFQELYGKQERYPHALKVYDALSKNPSDEEAQFSISTLDRLLKSNALQKALRLTLTNDGNVSIEADRAESQSVLKRLIKDIETKKITSRTLNETRDIEKSIRDTMKSAVGRLRLTKTADSFRVGGLTTSKPAPRPSGRAPSKGIVDKEWGVSPDHPRIVSIVDELQRLSYRSYPTAAAGLLRCLFEITLQVFREEVMGEKLSRNDRLSKFAPKAVDYAVNNNVVDALKA